MEKEDGKWRSASPADHGQDEPQPKRPVPNWRFLVFSNWEFVAPVLSLRAEYDDVTEKTEIPKVRRRQQRAKRRIENGRKSRKMAKAKKVRLFDAMTKQAATPKIDGATVVAVAKATGYDGNEVRQAFGQYLEANPDGDVADFVAMIEAALQVRIEITEAPPVEVVEAKKPAKPEVSIEDQIARLEEQAGKAAAAKRYGDAAKFQEQADELRAQFRPDNVPPDEGGPINGMGQIFTRARLVHDLQELLLHPKVRPLWTTRGPDEEQMVKAETLLEQEKEPEAKRVAARARERECASIRMKYGGQQRLFQVFRWFISEKDGADFWEELEKALNAFGTIEIYPDSGNIVWRPFARMSNGDKFWRFGKLDNGQAGFHPANTFTETTADLDAIEGTGDDAVVDLDQLDPSVAP